MPYNYAENRPFVFTEEGQETLLRIRDLARKHIELSGATCYAAITAGSTGSSWDILACVDRLVELGDLRRISNGATQRRRVCLVEVELQEIVDSRFGAPAPHGAELPKSSMISYTYVVSGRCRKPPFSARR